MYLFRGASQISTKPTVGLVGVRWRPEQAQVEADMWLERGDSRRQCLSPGMRCLCRYIYLSIDKSVVTLYTFA